MRIAVVTVSKSVHARIYVEYLVRAGHEVIVITNRDRYEVEGVRTVNTRPLRGRRLMLSDEVLLAMRDRKIVSALRGGDFDVVNVQMLLSDGITAALESDAPVVLTLFGSDVYLRDRLPDAYLERLPLALQRAAVVHACSQHMADELLAMGAPAESIVTFQYGVDPGLFRPLLTADRPHTIVSDRALRPLYRVHLLIEAMPAVVERIPDATLAIYDTGEEEPRLRTLVDELGVSGSVSFLGRAAPEDLAQVLGTAAVWASMAESDGTPISLLEAMSAGALPVVADLPTLHEWIAEPNGIFVEPDEAAVAVGLIAALKRTAASDAHVSANRSIVEQRANRAVNLARFEELLVKAAEKYRARQT